MAPTRHKRYESKTAALVAGAIGVVASSSGALGQCVQPAGTPDVIARTAAFGTGTALSSIVSTIGVVNTSSVAQSSAFTGVSGGNQPALQGGIWVREVGGVVDSKSNARGDLSTTHFLANDNQTYQGSFTQQCKVRTHTEYLGTQAGFDLARLNIGPATHIILGMTAGYTEVNVSDRTPDERTFRGNFQVPFGGIYASLTRGNLSIDGQLRYDVYSGLVSDNRPVMNNASDFRNQTLYSQALSASSLTFLANVGYRIDLASRWVIEPSLGIIWSKAEIDSIDSIGNRNFSFGGTPSARVRFEDVETQLGRASIRLGTTIPTSEVIWQPFLVGSVFHEFAGSAKARAVGDFSRFRFSDQPDTGTSVTSVTATRVGTYGHIGGGLAGVVLNTGWSGYARVDYRDGENLRGYNFNVGGRYQFAADQKPTDSLKDRPTAASAGHSWRGLYLGVSGGGLFTNSDFNQNLVVANNAGVGLVPAGRTTGGGSADLPGAGALLGGQVGYNLQTGGTVLGLEAEWAWSNARGGASCPGLDSDVRGVVLTPMQPDRAAQLDCRADLRGLGMVTGKIGFAWDRALAYLKGGLAFGEVESYSRFRRTQREWGEAHWQAGWALGAGIEYAVSQNWSIKGEYMHFDLGSEIFTIDNGTSQRDAGNQIHARVKTEGDVARVGVNYRFGGN